MTMMILMTTMKITMDLFEVSSCSLSMLSSSAGAKPVYKSWDNMGRARMQMTIPTGTAARANGKTRMHKWEHPNSKGKTRMQQKHTRTKEQ